MVDAPRDSSNKQLPMACSTPNVKQQQPSVAPPMMPKQAWSNIPEDDTIDESIEKKLELPSTEEWSSTQDTSGLVRDFF